MTYAKMGVHGRSEALMLPNDARETRLGVGIMYHPRLGSVGGGQGGFGGDNSQQSTVKCMYYWDLKFTINHFLKLWVVV